MTRIIAALILLTLPLTTFAADPTITAPSGSMTHGSSITITGANFGTKATPGPYIWDGLEDGVCDTTPDTPSTGTWSDVRALTVDNTPGLQRGVSTNLAVANMVGVTEDSKYAHFSGQTTFLPSKYYVSHWFKLADDWTWGTHAWPYHWVAGTNYALGDYVGGLANTFTGYGGAHPLAFMVTTDNGSAGGSEPVWDEVEGHTTVDGDLVWTAFTPLMHLSNIKSLRLRTPTTPLREFSLYMSSGEESRYIGYDSAGDITYPSPTIDPRTLFTTNTWHHMQFEWGESSGLGVSDGVLRWWFDGVLKVERTDLDTLNDNESYKYPYIVGFQRVWECSETDDNHIYLDDIYMDSVWSRIEIGDNATYASCTHREIQIPTVWADGSITFTVNRGSFGASDNAYLFVVDSTGDVSDYDAGTAGDQGYPVTFGNSYGSQSLSIGAGAHSVTIGGGSHTLTVLP